MRELRWPRLWLGVWLLGWLLAIVLSLVDPDHLPAPPGSDKLGHLLAYAALSGWATLIFRRGWPLCGALLALVVLGCGLEVAQASLTATRAMELLDAVANTAGVVLGGSLAFSGLPLRVEQLERALGASINRNGRGGA